MRNFPGLYFQNLNCCWIDHDLLWGFYFWSRSVCLSPFLFSFLYFSLFCSNSLLSWFSVLSILSFLYWTFSHLCHASVSCSCPWRHHALLRHCLHSCSEYLFIYFCAGPWSKRRYSGHCTHLSRSYFAGTYSAIAFLQKLKSGSFFTSRSRAKSLFTAVMSTSTIL